MTPEAEVVLTEFARLVAKLVAAELADATSRATPAEDRLVDAEEAARLLGVSVTWLRRNGSRLPFTKHLGRRTVRFSARGIQRWLNRRGL